MPRVGSWHEEEGAPDAGLGFSRCLAPGGCASQCWPGFLSCKMQMRIAVK